MSSRIRVLSGAFQVLILVLIALVPSGCQEGTATAEAENRELVLRMYREFDEGNLTGFQSSVSDTFSAHVMGNMTMDWNGFIEFGSQFLVAFPDGRHMFDYVLVEEDYVVTVGRYLGTHEGELMGIAPTHREIELAVMHIDRIENGRLVEHRGIGNAMDLMDQLGALDN
jgi:predicted ester cyclase